METKKNIIDRMDPVKVCFVVPFFLFWGGLITVSFSESALVYFFGLVPFYIYIYCAVNISEQSDNRQNLLASLILAVLSAGVLVVLLAVGVFSNMIFFRTIGRVAFINGPILLFFSFGGFFCVAFRLRWGCLFYDWPDSE